MRAIEIKRLAQDCGFELAGIASAEPLPDDSRRYLDWVDRGMAGAMGYLTDRRADIRTDPKLLLPSARSIICVGKLYNGPEPRSTEINEAGVAGFRATPGARIITMFCAEGLEQLAAKLGLDHEYKICVDTAPLLERSYARQAGLGWIGKNTCLINQEIGSWVFLGEILTSLDIESGLTARRIAAEPARAASMLVPPRPSLPEAMKSTPGAAFPTSPSNCTARRPRRCAQSIGQHVFGCDICQDVCPWNSRAPLAAGAGI